MKKVYVSSLLLAVLLLVTISPTLGNVEKSYKPMIASSKTLSFDVDAVTTSSTIDNSDAKALANQIVDVLKKTTEKMKSATTKKVIVTVVEEHAVAIEPLAKAMKAKHGEFTKETEKFIKLLGQSLHDKVVDSSIDFIVAFQDSCKKAKIKNPDKDPSIKAAFTKLEKVSQGLP